MFISFHTYFFYIRNCQYSFCIIGIYLYDSSYNFIN
ncbi:hypothetical protein [Anaerocolumna aminovalerica]